MFCLRSGLSGPSPLDHLATRFVYNALWKSNGAYYQQCICCGKLSTVGWVSEQVELVSVMLIYVLSRPVLNNKSSMTTIITFFLSSNATTWIEEMGTLRVFASFAEMLIIISMGLPVLYLLGKRLRVWTSGKVQKQNEPQ